jgi:beta-glucosidase
MIRHKNFTPKVLAFLVFLLFAASSTAAGQASKADTPAYKDPSLPIEKRVDDLVSRMTLDEKVLQMQHTAPAIPRLGIKSYDWWNEALHGVARSGHATMFPQAIGMAATWDTDLIHKEGRVISIEARAKYNQAQREDNHSIYYGLDFWSPNINIFRDPRWGRGQETLGEDPFLTGKLGSAFVRGVQGDDPKYFEAIATPKHYAVHSGPEPLRHGFNVNVSPYDLEDTYLPAFRETIVDAKAYSIMCVYNAVDGVPGCASPFLLQKTLRDDWKFDGYVTSDCGAVGDITTGHHYTPDNEHGSAAAVIAGTDTTCGNEYTALPKAVKDGLIKESEIDTAVKRLFTARMKLGMFDPPADVPFNKISIAENDSAAHRAVALKAARESMVLLKNSGILPLKPDVKTIAVVGPNAETLVALEGNYSGVPSQYVLPLDGMIQQFAGKAKVLYAQGSIYVPEMAAPAPRSIFHPSAESDEYGLKAEYYADSDFAGSPVLTRTDPQVQFDWNAAAPAPGIPMQTFSVRWTGTLTPPAAGDYTFSIRKFHCHNCEVNESVKITIDGKAYIDSRQNNPIRQSSGVFSSSGFTRRPTEPSFKIHFDNTQPHKFMVEYSHSAKLFGAGLTLEWQPPAEAVLQEAVKVAKQADVVVAFVGMTSNLEGEEMPVHVEGFDGGDRTDLGLPKLQQDLLEAMAATGKPLVVVLLNGSELAVNWAQEHAAAILEAWYPGEEGGKAIAETLAGDNNPGGRLPITFYASLDQVPPFTDYSMKNRTYRYFHGKPLYEFGHGLSYSTFAYSNLKLSSDSVEAGQPLTVEADVKNTSGVGGDEVAQLYLQYPDDPNAPIQALKGFDRVHVGPGETKHVTFTLSPRDLSIVTEKGERVVAAGNYSVFVGGGQPGTEGVKAQFKITGEEKLPR